MTDRDSLQRFLFEHFPVRGKLVHLDSSWREILKRHTYPRLIRQVLGEAMAATSLLVSTLKLDGALTLQLQGEGPLKLLVVRCTSGLALRGLARWEGEVTSGCLASMTGEGRLAVTLESNAEQNRYQSIVPLTGYGIADCLQAYFATSDQLPTRLWLAADDSCAAGLLLQRLPGDPGQDTDAWSRVSQLAGTVTQRELLTLPGQLVLRRLFHEEDLRLFESSPVHFACHCSRERVETILRGLGSQEVRSVLKEQGQVEAHCEFCNKAYRFDAVDVGEVFATDLAFNRPRTVH